MLTVAYLNTVWNVDEFSAMDDTLNIVSKCRFVYLNIRGLRKGPGKVVMGVLESPGKVLHFLSVKSGSAVSGRMLLLLVAFRLFSFQAVSIIIKSLLCFSTAVNTIVL